MMDRVRRFAMMGAFVYCAISTGSEAAVQVSQRDVLPETTFALVSIHLDNPNDSFSHISRMQFTEDGFEAEGTTVLMLVAEAYGLPPNRIAGYPRWTSTDNFTVHARISPEMQVGLKSADETQRRALQLALLRSLLADRFHFQAHEDTRMTPVLLLSVAQGGPRLKHSETTSSFAATQLHRAGGPVEPHMLLSSLGGGEIGGQGVSIQQLTEELSGQLNREVRDDTGLDGTYDFDLKWKQETYRARDGSGSADPVNQLPLNGEADSSLVAALKEQLGLRLESQKVSSKVLLFEHVEKPSDN